MTYVRLTMLLQKRLNANTQMSVIKLTRQRLNKLGKFQKGGGLRTEDDINVRLTCSLWRTGIKQHMWEANGLTNHKRKRKRQGTYHLHFIVVPRPHELSSSRRNIPVFREQTINRERRAQEKEKYYFICIVATRPIQWQGVVIVIFIFIVASQSSCVREQREVMSIRRGGC